MTYLVDCYPAFTQELLVSINVTKNIVAFIFLYVAVEWVETHGWVQVYMIMFMLTGLALILAIPFYQFGLGVRKAFERIILKVVGLV